MNKVELLAPSGNMESLEAAVQAGCDAVYLGLKQYSARAFAGNFSHDEFIEAVNYCHLFGVKVYVTFNTLLTENEFNNIKKEIQFVYENHVDAVIIQDLGLFYYIHLNYPDFDIHCSTQMHIHNLAGVKYMQDSGAKRVILARESPLDLIEEACNTGIDIEVFGYGAICISYSGQCLFSAVEKNRSANKGMCAQLCRMRYFKKDMTSSKEGEYLLSPKELNIIDHLSEVLDTGVSGIKIEGRMKRKEYVYLVIKTFREAIDAYYENKEYKVSNERLKELELLFNRGFSTGHLFKQDIQSRMGQYRPNHMGIEIGEVKDYKNGKVLVHLTDNLYQRDGLRIINEKEDIGLTAVVIEKNNLFVNEAKANDDVWLNCKEGIPQKGDKVHKTTDIRLIKDIDSEIDSKPRRIPLCIQYSAKVNQPFTITINDDLNNTIYFDSEFICEEAKSAPITKTNLEESLSKLGNTYFKVDTLDGELDNVFIPKSIINEARRNAIQQLEDLRTLRNNKEIKEEVIEPITKQDHILPHILINTDSDYEHDDVLNVLNLETNIVDENLKSGNYENNILNEVGTLYGEHTDCIGGMSLNITNSYALAYILKNKGITACILSSELNDEQISDLLNAFENRYGFKPFTYKFIYGRRNLMIIKDGFMREKIDSICDYHGNIYKLAYNNNNVFIKESKPHDVHNTYCDGVYMIFDDTQEIEERVEEVYEEIHG